MARTKKNLIYDSDQYNAYYGDFRGVDFSSDHTQVNRQRLAYAVNVFKNYQSEQGQAIETIPGFRQVINFPNAYDEVYGIHEFRATRYGRERWGALYHVGKYLYALFGYPEGVNVELSEIITLPTESSVVNGMKTFKINVYDLVRGEMGGTTGTVYSVSKYNGESLKGNWSYSSYTLSISRSDLSAGDIVRVTYSKGELESGDAIFTDMNEQKSTSFMFNNKLYIIDGKNYLCYDPAKRKLVDLAETDPDSEYYSDAAFIPRTYISIVPGETEISDAGQEYEQRNLLQPRFINTFVGDGVTTEYYLNENELEEICEVTVYGEILTEGVDYTVDLQQGLVTFTEAPKGAKDVEGYPEGYAGIEITAKKTLKTKNALGSLVPISSLITGCTVACTFDNRIFLSGNPDCPNEVYYCENNSLAGYIDATYFGADNHFTVGTDPAAGVSGLLPVANTLLILKGDSLQDGSAYYGSPVTTGSDSQPKIYSIAAGLAGTGCLGACVNFLDDPVFVSRLGLEGVGQLSTRNERAIEHRSSLVDAKLTNLDLEGAVLEEWDGYLLLLVDGKIFMADSRQRFTHDTGVTQYEWYYLEDIGEYKYQKTEYLYAASMPPELEGATVRLCSDCLRPEGDCICVEPLGVYIDVPLILADSVYDVDLDEIKNLSGITANSSLDGWAAVRSDSVSFEFEGNEYYEQVFFTVREMYDPQTKESVGYKALLCRTSGNMTGGTFYPATVMKAMNDTVYFGARGTLFAFNFDKRGEDGEIPPEYYTFNGRTIFSGCATRMDNCDVPHLTKSTIKKSTVIKTRALKSSAVKVKVRTNKKPYEQITRINSSSFSFESVDFSDFSFTTSDQALSTVREKEKKWIEKQYFIYSDEYMKPFALYYLSYRYRIAGRYKE